MKHRNTLLLGMCLCALGAQAQSVTVVLNDGRSEKWPVEQVKEIYFQASEEASETFNEIYLERYGSNFTVALKNDNCTVNLDAYGPAGFMYLPIGDYPITSDPGSAELYIDPGIGYTNVVKGEDTIGITSGTMTVSNEGPVYTFKLDLTLANGENFKGSYVGGINILSQYQTLVLSSVYYASKNEMEDGEIFVKFNDTAYSLEGAIDFFCEKGETILQEGIYNLSDSKEPFTFSQIGSYVDTFTPWANNKFTEGTINVTKEGEEYNVVMDLVFDCGMVVNYTYTGPINTK